MGRTIYQILDLHFQPNVVPATQIWSRHRLKVSQLLLGPLAALTFHGAMSKLPYCGCTYGQTLHQTPRATVLGVPGKGPVVQTIDKACVSAAKGKADCLPSAHKNTNCEQREKDTDSAIELAMYGHHSYSHGFHNSPRGYKPPHAIRELTPPSLELKRRLSTNALHIAVKINRHPFLGSNYVHHWPWVETTKCLLF